VSEKQHRNRQNTSNPLRCGLQQKKNFFFQEPMTQLQ
jgi:hypothetical protein